MSIGCAFHLQEKLQKSHLLRSGGFCMESNFCQLQSVKMLDEILHGETYTADADCFK
jgi:hypothetical protein